MAHKHCFRALDSSLRDVTRWELLPIPFGSLVVAFRDNFRQILPVVPKNRRHDIVHDTISA